MNKKQTIVLWIAVVIIVVIGLFPSSRIAPGQVFKKINPVPDYYKMLIYWVITIVVSSAAIYTLRNKKMKGVDIMAEDKMEAKANEDLVTTKTVIKWFEKTQLLISEKSKDNNSLTLKLCAVSIPIMKTYSCSIALLADKGFYLPSQALLRVVSEFFIKFVWFLNSDTEAELKGKLHRWEKSTGIEKVKTIKNLLKSKDISNTEEVNKLKKSLEQATKAVETNLHKEMPNITGENGLFQQTSNVFGSDVSAFLYRQFCSAVHIDSSILRGLMQGDGDDLIISDDIVGNLDDVKKRCLNFAYMFLMVVYKKVGLDISEVELEYNNLIRNQ